MSSLNVLPDHARLWLLALSSRPDPAVSLRLRAGLDALLAQWRHKGQVYQGAGEFLEPQLIAVAEPNLAAQPSGCAIDGMLRRTRRLVEELGLSLVDPDVSVLIRDQGGLTAIAKTELQARLEDGTLAADTPVLDLSLYSLGELRAGRLERPLGATWIARRYRLAVDA